MSHLSGKGLCVLGKDRKTLMNYYTHIYVRIYVLFSKS